MSREGGFSGASPSATSEKDIRVCLLRSWDEEEGQCRGWGCPLDTCLPHLYFCPTPDTELLSFHLHVPHSPMFVLSYLTYIPWKWLFLPSYHTVHTPQALGRWKLLELFFPPQRGE